MKNTSLFQNVVETIGLHAVKNLWANEDEYLDTFKLMTRVMKTHGQRHLISSKLIIHFFAVSYDWSTDDIKQRQAKQRDELLATLRQDVAS